MAVSMRVVVRNGAGFRLGTGLCAAALAAAVLGGCADQAGYAANANQPASYRVAGPVVAPSRTPMRDQACDGASSTFVDTCSGFARYTGP